ncbi:sensor histidine kinase [Ramlibacter sp.]|uniref:sensor histidine kinase n=1 Tax=Ramlibacter sp. TaxID=1917967 RepID=UPI003D14CC84
MTNATECDPPNCIAAPNAEALQRAIAARDRQLQIATHELRTPISTILLNLQMLEHACRDKDSIDSAVVTRLLEVPKRQLTRLVHMVDLLLDSAQVESDRLVLHRETLDLCALVHDVAARHSEMARGRGCVLDVRSCEPLFGEWDRLRMEQVVSNLVTNAIKYGGPRADLYAERTEEGARIVVEDTGRGIAPEDRARIFEPYERLVTASSGDGAGLGLYIVREIVRAHGGRIEVTGAPSGGARFTVLLPITTNENMDGHERNVLRER